MRRRFNRLTALACSLLLAAAPLQTALAEIANPERLADGLTATAEALEKIVQGVPHADYEIEPLAATLDGGPDAMAAWVAAHISHAVYRGTLKGAAGALEDRRGNSLDRALLLAALVQANGGTARLARTGLDDTATAKLMAAIAGETHMPAPALASELTDPILDALQVDPRVNGAAIKAGRASAAADAAAASAASDALRRKASAGLLNLVRARLPGEASEADTAALLADHWWVQVEEGGAWRDIDPDASIIGPQNASETIAADAVPETEKHRVTLRVVAETAAPSGDLGTSSIIERSYDTAAVNGRILVLSTQPLDAPAIGDLAARDDDIVSDYRAGTAWIPVLIIDAPDVQSIVKSDGGIIEASEANVQRLTGGAASAFDRNTAGLDQIGTGEEEPAEAPAGGLFTAAWLEFEIATPGAALRIERRMIFDAIGSEARSRGSYVGDLTEAAIAARGQALRDIYSIVIQGGSIAPARATARFAGSVAMARRVVADWLRGGAGEAGPDYPDEFRPPHLELTAWTMGRDGDAALAGTNIAMLRDTARAGDDGLIITQVFDIVANPVTGKDGPVRLVAGVGDTVLEHQLMGAPENSVNTAVAFAADLDAGKSWGLVAPGDKPALDALNLAPEAAALIQADLATGALVVARPNAELADATWWRIDPKTGETVGMTAAGGAEVAEYAVVASVWTVVFAGAIKLRCERSGGGRQAGQSYAECAAASYSNPFTKAGEAISKKIDGVLGAAGGDALKGL